MSRRSPPQSPRLAGHEPWRRRFCRQHGHADHRHRRHAGKLLHAARGRSATGPTRGIGRRPPSSPPAAPMACCRWMARSAIFRMTKASAPGPPLGHAGHGRQMGDPPQAGGAWPTRSSPPPKPPSPKRARSLPRWRPPRPPAQGATVYKGRLVDIASIKQAEVIVRQAEII
jgi:hypothetical protein